MSTRTLNKYRLFCVTENKFVDTWNDIKPSVCPTDGMHTIDTNSITIIDSISSNDVNVVQSQPGSTGDNYRVEGFSITIPANSQVYKDMSWNYPIGVMTVNFCIGSDHIGDIIDGYIAPNTTIGVLTQSVTQGDSVINVSHSVFQYLNVGYILTLTNGHQKVDLGECIHLDVPNNTITCELPANSPIAAGAYVQMSIHNIKNFQICEPANVVSLATKHLVSTALPKGIIARLVYTNKSNIDKTFSYYTEFLY
jgi:hypothetical protein